MLRLVTLRLVLLQICNLTMEIAGPGHALGAV